ncbi:MAG: hypothetical protein LBQ60_22035 [Bacteroidales bacterium]|jgi:hypothetical protein|nr:hypothetical protein [Bacteroidales bacterium]
MYTKKARLLFFGLGVLIVLLGIFLIMKLKYPKLSSSNQNLHIKSEDTLKIVRIFDLKNELSIHDIVADSVHVMFRLPHGACNCFETMFSDAVKNVENNIGENRVFVILSADKPREVYFFKERTKLTCPVYSSTDTLSTIYDVMGYPYACIVFPDMTINNFVPAHPDSMNNLIANVKKIILEEMSIID